MPGNPKSHCDFSDVPGGGEEGLGLDLGEGPELDITMSELAEAFKAASIISV